MRRRVPSWWPAARSGTGPRRRAREGSRGSWAALLALLTTVAAGEERAPVPVEELLLAVRALVDKTGTPARTPRRGVAARLPRPALTVARRLVRQRRHAAALELVELLLSAAVAGSRSGLPAVAQHARLSLGGTAEPDLLDVVTATLAGADAALADDDLPLAAELVDVGAGLLLHRDLHAVPAASPLVEDPETFLAPLRGSRAMALLVGPPAGAPSGAPPGASSGAPEARTDPAPAGDVPDGSAPGGEDASSVPAPGREHVVVLTGAYPRFARPLVDALRSHGHRVDVVELAEDHPPFRWIGTDPEQVLHRLRASGRTERPGGSWGYGVPAHHLEAVRSADVVVADWADKGAVWASVVAPPTTRLVVRLHGADVLSLWIHAVAWSRVDALLSVSAHQAELVEDVLRWGAAGRGGPPPRCHVVPNVVALPPVTDPPPREPWSLGLVGWGKPVKDPLWAVEVLARLRARGEHPWRLVLVGDDFPTTGGGEAGRSYAERFRERITRPDVAGAVELVGRSEQVEREVARLGFILSSSVRESFHLGLVEGVLGGAVPVVRDWPFFASRRGAASLFPHEWVVDDVDAAADRVWQLRDPDRRAGAAREAQQEAAVRFDPARTGAELVRLITGR